MAEEQGSWARLPERFERVGTFSAGIVRSNSVRRLLGARSVIYKPEARGARHLDAIVGWGARATSLAGVRFAHEHDLPFLRLEDGFIRSIELGVQSREPLSILVDDVGIYYDATRSSRLELMLEDAYWNPSPLMRARAASCIEQIVQHRISKYNHAPLQGQVFTSTGRPRVLVIDQTRGDLSVALGLADERRFHEMVEAALDENPGAEVVVKTHPDVIAGKKLGHVEGARWGKHVGVWGSDLNPVAVLEQADRVYAVTSQMGFEALLLGKPLTLFGMPFYAGWGATDDRVKVTRRTRRRTMLEIFTAAYLEYARYLDPAQSQRADGPEALIAHIVESRQSSRPIPEVVRLERVYDLLPVRAARRRHTQKAASPSRGIPSTAAMGAANGKDLDDDAAVQAALRGSSPQPQNLVEAAERALRWGGFDTALQLTLQALATPASTAAHATLTGGVGPALLRVYGEDSAADPLREALNKRFEYQGEGRRHGNTGLPLFELEELRKRREIDLPRVANELLRRLPRSAIVADAQLLLANAAAATAPQTYGRAIARYFDAHGLPPVKTRPSTAAMDRFAFTAPQATSVGPPVSILISAFNAQHTVVEAVRSCLNQSYRNLEVLVCDDRSTDETWEVLRSAFASNPQVRLFRGEHNQGGYNARNALLQYAVGELIGFHDADDLAFPGRIAAQVRTLRASSAQACVADWVRLRPDGTFPFFFDHRATRMATVSTLVRRSAFGKVPGFRSARVGADDEFLVDLELAFGAGAIVRLYTPVLFGLWSAGSLTRTQGMQALETGYKAELRRAYSELVFRRRILGLPPLDPQVDAALQRVNNLVPPSKLLPIQSTGIK